MATVKIIEPRQQEAHFGLYRTSVGGDESIVVRRKIADPTDYMHTHSRKLQIQRHNFSLATKHYAQLTPSQKAITRHQFEEIEYQKSHGKTDTKLLMGRQLFISKDIRSLNVTQKRQRLPLEVCIQLTDSELNPLDGLLLLFYKTDDTWSLTNGREITRGNWLFSQVPPEKSSYHPYGQAIGYVDLEDPLTTYLTESQLKHYHHHILLRLFPKICYFDPKGYAAVVLHQGEKYSQPLRTLLTFNLQNFWICLMRRPGDYYTPPATGWISLHHTAYEGKPIDPPIASTSFNISVPNLYEHKWHRIPFPSLTLEANTLYAWVLGSPGNWDWYHAVNVRIGADGRCNLDPTYQRWKSRHEEGSWLPWEQADPYKMFYEARGIPLP